MRTRKNKDSIATLLHIGTHKGFDIVFGIVGNRLKLINSDYTWFVGCIKIIKILANNYPKKII